MRLRRTHPRGARRKRPCADRSGPLFGASVAALMARMQVLGKAHPGGVFTIGKAASCVTISKAWWPAVIPTGATTLRKTMTHFPESFLRLHMLPSTHPRRLAICDRAHLADAGLVCNEKQTPTPRGELLAVVDAVTRERCADICSETTVRE